MILVEEEQGMEVNRGDQIKTWLQAIGSQDHIYILDTF